MNSDAGARRAAAGPPDPEEMEARAAEHVDAAIAAGTVMGPVSLGVADAGRSADWYARAL